MRGPGAVADLRGVAGLRYVNNNGRFLLFYCSRQFSARRLGKRFKNLSIHAKSGGVDGGENRHRRRLAVGRGVVDDAAVVGNDLGLYAAV